MIDRKPFAAAIRAGCRDGRALALLGWRSGNWIYRQRLAGFRAISMKRVGIHYLSGCNFRIVHDTTTNLAVDLIAIPNAVILSVAKNLRLSLGNSQHHYFRTGDKPEAMNLKGMLTLCAPMHYILDMRLIMKPFAVLTLVTSISLCLGQRPAQSLSFSSEDERVADFVQLPQSVLVLLLSDKEDFPNGDPANVHCEDHEQAGDEPRPEILCRRIPLSSQPGDNYLVIGVGGLRGAHIVPYWLFHRGDHGASLLFKTRSDQFEITPKRFNGYAEIRSTWIMGAGATIVTDSFRFDGKSYVRYHRQTQHQ